MTVRRIWINCVITDSIETCGGNHEMAPERLKKENKETVSLCEILMSWIKKVEKNKKLKLKNTANGLIIWGQYFYIKIRLYVKCGGEKSSITLRYSKLNKLRVSRILCKLKI